MIEKLVELWYGGGNDMLAAMSFRLLMILATKTQNKATVYYW